MKERDKQALAHHGIFGMHWGIRRYQNPDGSLTPEGRERYRSSNGGKKSTYLSSIKKKGSSTKSDKTKSEGKSKQDSANKKTLSDLKKDLDINEKKFKNMNTKLLWTDGSGYGEKYATMALNKIWDNDSSIRNVYDSKEDWIEWGLYEGLDYDYPENRETLFLASDEPEVPAYKEAMEKYEKSERAYWDAYFKKDKIAHAQFDAAVDKGRDFLMHWGILGMHWGIRRFQNPDGSLTPEGRERYGSRSGGTKSTYMTTVDKKGKSTSFDKGKLEVKYTKKQIKDHKEEDQDREGKNHHSYVTNLAVSTAAVSLVNPVGAAAATLTNLGMAAYAKGKTAKYFKDRENAPIDEKTGLHLKTKEMTEIQDARLVNPEFYSFNDNSKNNCALCSATYDLRRRGYDVTSERACVGYTDISWKKWYPDCKIMKVPHDVTKKGKVVPGVYRNILKELKSQPEGARGTILSEYSTGLFSPNMGHSFIYEIKNGKPRIIDAQAGSSLGTAGSIFSPAATYDPLIMSMDASIVRLDNATPDWKAIKEVCR